MRKCRFISAIKKKILKCNLWNRFVTIKTHCSWGIYFMQYRKWGRKHKSLKNKWNTGNTINWELIKKPNIGYLKKISEGKAEPSNKDCKLSLFFFLISPFFSVQVCPDLIQSGLTLSFFLHLCNGFWNKFSLKTRYGSIGFCFCNCFVILIIIRHLMVWR